MTPILLKTLVLFCGLSLGVAHPRKNRDAAPTPESCVEYVPGNFNMVITAPHGGLLSVPNCPVRSAGCMVNKQCVYDSSSTCTRDPKCDYSYLPDSNTQDIARDIQTTVNKLYNKTPHLVIMRCTRETLDVNREINEAAQKCSNAETAYNLYHDTIANIITTFNGGKGLLLDIHGQAHKQNATELGYGVDKEDFDAANVSPTKSFPAGALSEVTIPNLLKKLVTGSTTNWDVLAGKLSMGKYFEDQGLRAIPGPVAPAPGFTTYQYFNGGYTIRTHSQRPGMDAIQMEGPGELRNGGPAIRTAFAQAQAAAAVNFWKDYYAN